MGFRLAALRALQLPHRLLAAALADELRQPVQLIARSYTLRRRDARIRLTRSPKPTEEAGPSPDAGGRPQALASGRAPSVLWCFG